MDMRPFHLYKDTCAYHYIEMPKHLVMLEITHGMTVWMRSVVVRDIPVQEDIAFYYNRLCGFSDAKVTIHTEAVPDNFNDTLLNVTAPTSFPACDLATDLSDTEKRGEYANYIHRLCEMERSRERLQVFSVPSKGAGAGAGAVEKEVDKETKKRRAWVEELLRSLHEEEGDCEELACIESEQLPQGWVFTPTSYQVRTERGSRFVNNPQIGKKWEALLGTDVYPDIVVSRRISTLTWAFQHAKSEALVQAAIDWYLVVKCATLEDGMTDWIPNADGELNGVMATFRRIKVNDKLLVDDVVPTGLQQTQVYKMMMAMESILVSSLEAPVEAIPMPLFKQYIHYMFQAHGIARERYVNVGIVDKILARWVRGNMGFRLQVEPMFGGWAELWRVVVTKSTVAHVSLFIQTLECHDVLEVTKWTKEVKQTFANAWVRVCLDNEAIIDPTGNARTRWLHEQIGVWCYKYIPKEAFVKQFGQCKLGPILATMNFHSHKFVGGRQVRGIRFRTIPPEVSHSIIRKPGRPKAVVADETPSFMKKN